MFFIDRFEYNKYIKENNIKIKMKKVLISIFAIYLFLKIDCNMFLEKQKYNGRKIKKNKSPIKNKIKKSIKNNMNNNFFYTGLKKSEKLENLSQSAIERYKLNNIFINSNIESSFSNKYSTTKKTYITDYLMNNYKKIILLMNQANINILKNNFESNIFFLYYINSILRGENLQSSFFNSIKKINYIKKNNLLGSISDISNILQVKKSKVNPFEEKTFDSFAIRLLKKSLIWNGSNETEIGRLLNTIYDYSNRDPVIITISSYPSSDMNAQEANTTYGELGVGKDAYRNILFNKNMLNSPDSRGEFDMLHRNIPDGRPQQILSFLIIPEIRSNIVEYFVILDDINKIEKIKIDEIIKKLDKNFFYLISIFNQNDINELIKN